MGKYIGKRILLLVPAVFLVCVIVFALMRLVPGDAVDSIIYKYSSMGISADRCTTARPRRACGRRWRPCWAWTSRQWHSFSLG